MRFVLSILAAAIFTAALTAPAEAQLFGQHTERQWLEGEVAIYDPLQRFVEEDAADELAVDLSLTYVYAKVHSNVHIVGNLRYLHAITEGSQTHRGYGAGIRLTEWGGYAQGIVAQIDAEWNAVISAGYYISPRIGVRANWYAGAEDTKAGHISAGVVWRF